jgi:chromosome segregation ATPase
MINTYEFGAGAATVNYVTLDDYEEAIADLSGMYAQKVSELQDEIKAHMKLAADAHLELRRLRARIGLKDAELKGAERVITWLKSKIADHQAWQESARIHLISAASVMQAYQSGMTASHVLEEVETFLGWRGHLPTSKQNIASEQEWLCECSCHRSPPTTTGEQA